MGFGAKGQGDVKKNTLRFWRQKSEKNSVLASKMRKNGRFFNFQRHFQEKTFEKKRGIKWGQKGDKVGIFFGILSLKKFAEREWETTQNGGRVQGRKGICRKVK